MTDISKYAVPAWGQPNLIDLELPSGGLCQIKSTIDFEEIIALGIMDKLDSLGVVVSDHIDTVKKPGDHKAKQLTKAEQKAKLDEDFMRILNDPVKFNDLLEVVDKLVCAIVVQPEIVSAYETTGDGSMVKVLSRKEGVIYSDSIPFPDKMHIFGHAMGGVNKMKSFLE